MSPVSAHLAHPDSPAQRVAVDRRRHPRFPVSLLGRFMRASKQEYPGKLYDISIGGAAIMSPIEPEQGERIVAFFDQIGVIEGTVVRQFEGGFAIKLTATQHKREKLAAQITWLINRHELTSAEDRRHERIAVAHKLTAVRLPDGMAMEARLLDLSVSGASLGTSARPPIGAEISVGQLPARVMRHHDQGIGVQFVTLQDADSLRRHFD